MPRVTPEHAEARRQQILAAARACFLRDGFHQTSMQDIQREAGLSAGAIYLYFKGKNDIIVGLAAQILTTLTTLFPEEPPDTGPPPTVMELVEAFLGQAERLHRETGLFPLAIQIWAEAGRNQVMREALLVYLEGAKERLRHLVEAYQKRGALSPDADPAAVTLALIGLGQGYIVQRTVFGDPDALRHYLAGVRALFEAATAAFAPVPVDDPA